MNFLKINLEMELIMIESLTNKPSKKTLRYLAIFSFILLIVSMIFVMILLEMSNFSGTLEETQLGFNGEYIKSIFAFMNENEMVLFLLANILDYAFMLAYGAFFYSTALILARKLKEGSLLSKVGYNIVILGVISACCDALENLFLLLMVSNPVDFPMWLAIPHSSFAIIKFALIYVVFGWLVIISLSRLFVRRKKVIHKVKSLNFSFFLF